MNLRASRTLSDSRGNPPWAPPRSARRRRGRGAGRARARPERRRLLPGITAPAGLCPGRVPQGGARSAGGGATRGPRRRPWPAREERRDPALAERPPGSGGLSICRRRAPVTPGEWLSWCPWSHFPHRDSAQVVGEEAVPPCALLSWARMRWARRLCSSGKRKSCFPLGKDGPSLARCTPAFLGCCYEIPLPGVAAIQRPWRRPSGKLARLCLTLHSFVRASAVVGVPKREQPTG